MEAESEGETLARSSSTDQDKTKESHDPSAKTLKHGALQGCGRSMTGGSNVKGSRISENGVVGDECSSKKLFLEDSEMNWASTLMEMKQSGGGEGLRGLDTVLDVIDSAEKSGGDRDKDVGYVSGEFSEGDFVWSKVRNHLWWPGRVYDPSKASDHANKLKQGDTTLVAYFGDGTFAWCNPSDLKPLGKDFVEMSKQSRSKNFVNAVDRLLDEVATLVESKMLCSCVPREFLTGLGRKVAVNAGIEEEVLVPEAGLENFPAHFFQPSHCLFRLKGFAQFPGLDNMLEVTVLKSWLSAYYRAKGGRQLYAYHDPQPISGLEDEAASSDYSGEGEIVTQGGPAEYYTLSFPIGPESQQNLSCMQKCQEVPEDQLYQKRKQKSIAEIIGISTDAKTENREDGTAEKEKTASGSKTSKAERKKKKDGDECGDAKGRNDVTGSAKKSLSGRKKRKVVGEDDSEKSNRAVDAPESGASGGNPVSVSGKSKRKSTDEGVDAESTLSSTLKRNKAGKLPESNESPEVTISPLVTDGSRVEESHSEKENKKGKETSDGEVGGSADKIGEDMGASQKERADNEPTSDKRERKKSKYLSFPFVSIKTDRKKEMEVELKISSEEQLGKQMTRSGSDLGVSPVGKSRDGTPHTKTPEEHGQDHEASVSGPPKPNQDERKVTDPRNVEAPAVEVLSRLLSAAHNPQRLEGDNSLVEVECFLSDFRSSRILDGSQDEIFRHKQAGRRRMSGKLSSTLSIKEQDLTKSSSPNDKSRQSKSRKTKGAKSDGKSKEKGATTGADTTDEDRAVLLVSFNPASMLPTKDILIKTYEKYGALGLEDADTYDQKWCARIMFSKNSKAEEAFNDSQIVSPFPEAKATFRLQYLSKEMKIRELNSALANEAGNPPAVKPTAAPEPAKLPAIETSQLGYVKGKLAGIAAMLENPEGKISKKLKSKLQREVDDVLQKVSAMAGQSSSSSQDFPVVAE